MLNTMRFPQRRGMKASSIALLAMAMAVRASGQVYWTGTGSDEWFDNTSWSTGIQPTSNDTVYVGYDYGSTTFTNPGSLTLNVLEDLQVGYAKALFSKSIIYIGNFSNECGLEVSGNVTTTSKIELDELGTLTLGNSTVTGTVDFVGFNRYSGELDASSLTLSSGSLIDSIGGGTMRVTNNYLNQGTITSDEVGTQPGILYVSTGSTTNQGTISAINGSTLNLGGTSGSTGDFDNSGGTIFASGSSSVYAGNNGEFKNTGGTISATGGSLISVGSTGVFDNTGGTISAQGNSTVHIYGNSTIAQLGTIQASDTSQIYLGNIDNTGNTLDVSSWGPWGSILLGGTLSNGKVTGTSLGFGGGLANNVEFLNTQTLSGTLGVGGSTQFDQGLYVIDGGELYIAANQTLPENVSLDGGTITAGNYTLAIGSGTTLPATGTFSGNVIDNKGTISASGGELDILPTSFQNEGTLSVANSGYLYFDGQKATNTGTISALSGSVINFANGIDNTGGTISAAGNSLIYFTGAETAADLGKVTAADSTSRIFLGGTIDNTGNTLDVSSWGPAGSIVLSGTLKNGKVAGTSLDLGDSAYNQINPSVQNVEFLAPQTLDSSVTLNVIGGVQFDGGLTLGANSTLSFTNSGTLTSNVTLGSFAGGYSYINIQYGTLLIGSGVTIQGHGGAFIDASNSKSTIDNEGDILDTGAGDMYITPPQFTNDGTLGVGGNRTIHVESNFIQTNTGVLSFILNSNSQFGQMDFTKTAVLAGSVDVSLLAGYSPKNGTEWDIMNFTKGYAGTLTAPTGFALIYNTDSIYLEEMAATPEPKSALVLAAGGLCVFFKRRRKRSTAV